MAQIGALTVKLGLVTLEFDKATDQAKARAKGLKESLNSIGDNVKDLAQKFSEFGGMTSLSLIGIGELSRSTLEFANQTKDLADAYDISIAKSLQFGHALQISGGNAEMAGRMLSKMFEAIGNAKGGASDAVYQFEKIGLSIKDMVQLSPGQQIDAIVDALGKMTDVAQRTQSIKFFGGKGSVTTDFAAVAETMKNTAYLFAEQEVSIKAFAATSENLKTSMMNLKLAFADMTAPFLSSGLVSIAAFKTALLSIASFTVVSQLGKIAVLFGQIVISLAAGATLTGAMSLNFVAMAAGVAALGAAFYGWKGGFDTPLEAADKKIAKIKGEIDRMNKAFEGKDSGSSSINGMARGPNPIPFNNAAMIEQVRKLADAEIDKAEIISGLDATKRKDDEKSLEAQVAQIKSEVEAANAKMDSQSVILGITRQINNAKLAGVAGDKLASDLRVLELTQQAEIAAALGTRNAAAKKVGATQGEIAAADRQYGIDVQISIDKQKSAAALLNAENKKKIDAIQVLIDNQATSFKLDVEGFAIKQKALTLDSTAISLLESKLQLEKDLLKIDQELAKSKINSNPKQFAADEEKAKQDRAQAVITQAAAAKLIADTSAKELSGMKEQTAYQKILADFSVQKLTLEGQRYYMTQHQHSLLAEELDLEQKLAEIKQRGMDAVRAYGQGARLTEAQLQLKGEEEAAKALSKIRTDQMVLDNQRQQSFSEGWDKAYRDYVEASTNASKAGGDAFNSVVSNMNSALDNFVESGKLSFKDLAGSIIKDLIKIQLKANATGLFQMLVNSVMAPDASAVLSPYFTPGHAGGGVAAANSPTMVGENGPELFIPKQSGAVIPNHAMGTSLGGTTNVTNNYIQAIDTKSFEERLYGSSNAIWAANQYAGKSLAVNRGRA